MKFRHILLIVLLVLIADQSLKIYIKTNFYLGQSQNVIGNWFKFYFIENEGMAWGLSFGGSFGKIALTLFRLFACIAGTFYLNYLIKRNLHKGLLISAAFIYAGAVGNLIDSLFYGIIFEGSDWQASNIAKIFPIKGYASLLHGKVVDMLYFPIIEDKLLPSWVPFWGGKTFTFFSPIFNIADASISLGAYTIIMFQRKFFKSFKAQKNEETTLLENQTEQIEN